MPSPADTTSRDQQIQAVTADLLKQAEPVLGEIARLLVDTPDEKLFGATEFALRDKVLKLVAVALNARLGEKKAVTTGAASTVPGAAPRPDSTATDRVNHSGSGAKSSVRGRITTAAPVEKGSRRGIKKSD
jgi:hypothetical protein